MRNKENNLQELSKKLKYSNKASKLHKQFFIQNSEKNDLFYVFDKSLNVIKQIEELNNYKTYALETDEMVAKYYLFATMIGVIDRHIAELNNKIIFEKNCIVNIAGYENSNKYRENDIKKYEYMISVILKQRDNVIDYLRNFSIKSLNYDKELYTRVLSIQPSYTMFFELYGDIVSSSLSRFVDTEIINAYNLGYAKALDRKYDETYDYFIRMVENINQYKNVDNTSQQPKKIIKILKNV